MVDIGRLNIPITSEGGDFRRELAETDAGIDRLTATARRARAALAGMATAAVAGFAFVARQNRELRIGAGIAGVTVQEYEGLSRAFRAYTDDARFVADITNDLSERLRDAQEGTQSYADAFRLAGVSLEELANVDRADRILFMARALARLDADSQQLVANELFGDQGQVLVAVLRDLGEEGLAARIAETMAAADITDAQSRRVQEATTQLSDLRAELEELALIGTAGGVNIVQTVLGPVAEALGEIYGFLRLDPLTPEQQQLIARYEEVAEQYRALRGEAGFGPPGLPTFTEEITVLAEAIPRVIAPLEQLRVEVDLFSRTNASENFRAQLSAAFDNLGSETGRSFSESFQRSLRSGLATADTEGIAESARRNAAQEAERERIRNAALNRINQQRLEAINAEEQRIHNLRVARTQAWGSAITTITNAAIADTENWGEVLLGVLANILVQASAFEGGFGAFFGFGGSQQFGGPIPFGGDFIVGERGPERVFIPGGSFVQPNGSGDTFVFNLNGDRRAEENVTAFEQQVIPRLNRIIDARIEQRRRRGV